MGKLTKHFLTKVAVSLGLGALYAGIDYYINDENSLIGEIKKAHNKRKMQRWMKNRIIINKEDYEIK